MYVTNIHKAENRDSKMSQWVKASATNPMTWVWSLGDTRGGDSHKCPLTSICIVACLWEHTQQTNTQANTYLRMFAISVCMIHVCDYRYTHANVKVREQLYGIGSLFSPLCGPLRIKLRSPGYSTEPPPLPSSLLCLSWLAFLKCIGQLITSLLGWRCCQQS